MHYEISIKGQHDLMYAISFMHVACMFCSEIARYDIVLKRVLGFFIINTIHRNMQLISIIVLFNIFIFLLKVFMYTCSFQCILYFWRINGNLSKQSEKNQPI